MPRGLLACALSIVLFGASLPADPAALHVEVRERGGKPFGGAIVTLYAETGALPAQPPLRAIVDQVKLAFVPDLLVIPVGSTVEFPNSDAVGHQVYSFSPARRFQLPLYRGKTYPPVTFDKPGLVSLGCNIHDNMLAYLVVTDAPRFGRTDAGGVWVATDLPAGRYRVHAWHPRMNEADEFVEGIATVAADGDGHVRLQLKSPLRPAAIGGRPRSWDAY
jgi:plastocyanin